MSKEETQQEKIIRLEQTVEQLNSDVNELKRDFKGIRSELTTWFDRLDGRVQDLRLSQTRLEEQMVLRGALEDQIRDELREAKRFRAKVLLALASGFISLVIYLIQDMFLR